MKISIVTVVRNGAETIEDTIESVAGQFYPQVEHIIVDGASTDGTVAIVERYRSCLATILSEPDDGIYDAMNKGIGVATGEVIGTLNADDMYAHEHVLETVARTFQESQIDACYADLVYVDRRKLDRVIRYWTSKSFQPGLFQRGWIPAHPTFYVRREVYERLGRFDLDFKIQSDFELTLRFLEVHRIRARYIPEIWVKMRMGGTTNNSIVNIVRGNLESYRACKRHGLRVTPLFFLRKAAMRIPQFFRRPRA